MRKFKFLVCVLVVSALLLPYTAFAVENTSYGYGEGEIYDVSPSYYNASFSLQSDTSELTTDEISMLKYIAEKIPEFNGTIDGLEQFNISVPRFKNAVGQYISSLIQLEYPEIYYVDMSLGYRYSYDEAPETHETTVTSIELHYTMTKDEADAKNEIIDNEVNTIVADASRLSSDLEKVLYVHDYIVANYRYDTTYESRTLDTMVAQKTGVCQGYAHLFFTIMKKLDIPCVNVPNIYNARIEAGHIWNKVMVDNEWYNIDLTYDDPIGYFDTEASHDYFLLSDDEIKVIDNVTYQPKNEHVKMETKRWDGSTDIPEATTNSAKYAGFRRISGATFYKDNAFWGLDDNGHICLIKLESDIIPEMKYNQINNYSWRIWDHKNYAIGGKYYSLIKYDGRLFYNTPSAVYEFNTDDYTIDLIYEYNGIKNECETYLYGLNTFGGKLYAIYTEAHLSGSNSYTFKNTSRIELDVPHKESEPEPKPEVFPVFDKGPLPCTVETPEIVENKMVNKETQETEVVSYNVSVDVTIPEEVTTKTEKAEKPVTVVAAQYDEKGCFLGFAEIQLTEGDNNKKTATFTAGGDCNSVKTFVWSGFIMPLAMAEAIGLTAQTE